MTGTCKDIFMILALEFHLLKSEERYPDIYPTNVIPASDRTGPQLHRMGIEVLVDPIYDSIASLLTRAASLMQF